MSGQRTTKESELSRAKLNVEHYLELSRHNLLIMLLECGFGRETALEAIDAYKEKEVGYSLLSAIVGAVQTSTDIEYKKAVEIGAKVCDIIKPFDWVELCDGTTFTKTFEPNPIQHDSYQFYFNLYKETYPRLKDLMHQMVMHEQKKRMK